MHYVDISLFVRTKYCFSLSIFVVFTLKLAAMLLEMGEIASNKSSRFSKRKKEETIKKNKVVNFQFQSEYVK